MSVVSAPHEQSSSELPRARVSRANAFRILSIPADADLKKIARQQARLLNEIEMGVREGTRQYGLPPLRDISKEEIVEADYLLARPDSRLIEELFWVHEMNGPPDGELDHVLGGLRWTAADNTTHGAVARHNLAVMQSVLGQECPGMAGWDHWNEALKIWKELMDNGLFWTFMEDRAVKLECRKSTVGMMTAAVRRQLSSSFSEEMLRAAKSGDLAAVPALRSIAMEHSAWLELDAALSFVGVQQARDGFVALGAILDRLAEINKQDTKANIRDALAAIEQELSSAATEYGQIVHSLGELVDGDSWDDAVASSYQRLSVAYLSLLDDSDRAGLLISRARELARDAEIVQSLERDARNIERFILLREANTLARGGDFAAAERKLTAALAISTEEQGTEIKATLELHLRARQAMERDRQQGQQFTLRREADVLAQRGDSDGDRFRVVLAVGIAASVIALVTFAVIAEGRKTAPPSAPPGNVIVKPGRDPEQAPTSVPDAPPSKRVDIEQERTALIALGHSLDDRKTNLDAEGSELQKQRHYLDSVASFYAGQDVPVAAKSVYETVQNEHNSREMKYNASLAAWKADHADYDMRVNALNARTQKSNGAP